MSEKRRWYHDDTLHIWLIMTVMYGLVSYAATYPSGSMRPPRLFPWSLDNHSAIICPFPPPEPSELMDEVLFDLS